MNKAFPQPSRRNVLKGIIAGSFSAAAPPSTKAACRERWDTVVIGAGVFGAWTAWFLNRLGQKVLLVDAWGPAHARASSGGETRLIRTEYGGNPLYTRWAWESLAYWIELSGRHEASVFRETGALYLYPRDTPQTRASWTLHQELRIPVERVESVDLARRWPQVDFDGILFGILQPTMGVLMARRSVQLLVRDFQNAGGEYRQFAVTAPRAKGEMLDKINGSGGNLAADQFVFACGPWLPKLFPEVINDRIVPSRQNVFFFLPNAGDTRFDGDRLPAWVDNGSEQLHYGFPNVEGRGFKVALDRHGACIDPDTMDRRIPDDAVDDIRKYMAKRFPALRDNSLAGSRVCQYENTDNGDFLIARHPEWSNVWIAGGGSGHGFKHGPAVGRYVAQLALGVAEEKQRLSLSEHRPHRTTSCIP